MFTKFITCPMFTLCLHNCEPNLDTCWYSNGHWLFSSRRWCTQRILQVPCLGNRPMTTARRTRHPKTFAAQARARSTCMPGPHMFLKLGNGGFGWFGARMGHITNHSLSLVGPKGVWNHRSPKLARSSNGSLSTFHVPRWRVRNHQQPDSECRRRYPIARRRHPVVSIILNLSSDLDHTSSIDRHGAC
jgi:hypothetical protein